MGNLWCFAGFKTLKIVSLLRDMMVKRGTWFRTVGTNNKKGKDTAKNLNKIKNFSEKNSIGK